jgi:hypothetical protein
VSARHGDLERAFDVLLSLHVGEIVFDRVEFAQDDVGIDAERLDIQRTSQKFSRLPQVPDGIDVETCDDGGFGSIGRGKDEAPLLVLAGGKSDGQRAFHRSDFSGQREFTDDPIVLHIAQRELLGGRDDTQRHGQIEAGPLFLDVGRGKIERDPSKRKSKRAVHHRRDNPVAAFLDGRVGQSDDYRHGFTRTCINFDFDGVSIDAPYSSGENLGQHRTRQTSSLSPDEEIFLH